MAQGVTATEIKSKRVLEFDATDAAITYTLPLATDTNIIGRQYVCVKADSSANAVTISAASINGDTTFILEEQYDTVTIYSNGTNFKTIGRF